MPFLAIILASALALPSALERPHPHYPRKVEIELPGGQSMSVSHLTVTFDKEGFEKTPAGGTWHLANGQFETTASVKLGGQTLEPGKHSLKARKRDDGTWELVIDAPGRFAKKLTAAARPLKTDFVQKAPLMEHLSIDIHPSGDKEHTRLWLNVHFATYIARTAIEL
jgi:hypothetical protein